MQLYRSRSFKQDTGLVATALFAWFLLNGFYVDINASSEALRMSIEHPQWQPHWSLGPWVLAVFGLVLVYLRWHFMDPGSQRAATLHRRLQQLMWLSFSLSLLRLLSLWDPMGHLFPYLSLLWAPHATWALSLLFVVFLHAPVAAPEKTAWSIRHIAILLFLVSLLLYGGYTLYFCQVTMLHGDEGQYLLVTQSLINDRDMDLTNNLDPVSIGEFHTVLFDLHKAPSSPPGKVYSIHPIGLSALLVPAYWAGMEMWQNPRLGCALFMAFLAAACVPLFFIWLVRIGVDRFRNRD